MSAGNQTKVHKNLFFFN